MNNLRVLRFTNVTLMLAGFQMHWFDSKLQRYRISLPGALHILVLAVVYAACFARHFQPSPVLKTLLDVSPFLFGLTRVQLLLSIKVFGYAIYASVRAVGVANRLLESLPMRSETKRGGLKNELVAFGLLYSTFFVFLCILLYIAYEMQFKLPTVPNAMLIAALFLPHLVLASSLRFYSIFAWLTRDRLRQLDVEVYEVLSSHRMKTELELVTTTTYVPVASMDNLESLSEQLQQLVTRFGDFFQSLQRCLLLLMAINGHCLLFGLYSYVFYSSTWYMLFEERKRRVFYAANVLIYACICCDYACLLLTQIYLERQRVHFSDRLNCILSQRTAFSKRIRNIVKDMRCVLANSFQFKFVSLCSFNLVNFLLIQFIQLLVVSLIVMYHYLNDAIQQLNDRLDISNEE